MTDHITSKFLSPSVNIFLQEISNKMPFKIVQTIENQEKFLSVVPHKWEQGGILYWPKNGASASKLQKNEHSAPLPDWNQMRCTRKRELIRTYKDAEAELARMQAESDTEMDDSQIQVDHKRIKTNRRAAKPLPEQSSIDFDFNELLVAKSSNMGEPDSQHAVLKQMVNNEGIGSTCSPKNRQLIILQNDVLASPIVQDAYFVSEPLENGQQKTNAENIRGETDIDVQALLLSNQSTIISNQEIILSNQHTIISQQARLQTVLDTVMALIPIEISYQEGHGANTHSKKTSKQCEVCDETFPVKDIKSFSELEENLKDVHYENELVEKFSLIGGRSGKENGFDVCYKLIDSLLERDFVDTFSWTGNSKEGPTKAKNALKYYHNFRRFFLTIVRRADNEFSELNFDKFLKRILKNSGQRKASSHKITSTHKNRSTRLNKDNPNQKATQNKTVIPENEADKNEEKEMSDEENQEKLPKSDGSEGDEESN